VREGSVRSAASRRRARWPQRLAGLRPCASTPDQRSSASERSSPTSKRWSGSSTNGR